jgi:thiaminase/transcriptional activator TenA
MIVDKMRHAVDGIMNTIHHHAFNVELSEGILPREKFIFYLIQDALYLADFAKALALTAGRLVNNTHVQQFIQFALDAIKAECELHFGYIDKYRSSTDLAFDLTVEQSPTCFMYTNYLLKMASLASVEEAVSSLLPCFLVYNEVGKRMASHQISNNPYHDWIALYSSDAFELSVSLAIQITNELALTASECIQEKNGCGLCPSNAVGVVVLGECLLSGELVSRGEGAMQPRGFLYSTRLRYKFDSQQAVLAL